MHKFRVLETHVVKFQKSKPYPITIDHVEDQYVLELWVLLYSFKSLGVACK